MVAVRLSHLKGTSAALVLKILLLNWLTYRNVNKNLKVVVV